MGLYDYLGGEQVKCFGRPSVGISPNKDGSFKLFVHCAGGELKGYSRGDLVPYATPFYNFGKDFMVFDYRTFNYETSLIEPLLVHIIKDGRYFRSVNYDVIHSQFDIPLVLDNYGEVINVKAPEDFKKIVLDWRESHIKYDALQDKYREEMGIPNLLRMNRFEIEALHLSNEDFKEILDKNNECMERANKESLLLFSKTWYEPVKELNSSLNAGWPLGALYYSLVNYKFSEFDKYWIARLFVKNFDKDINEAKDEYYTWCAKNDIQVDVSILDEFFDKYLADIPESVINDYNNSEDKAFRDKVYGIH